MRADTGNAALAAQQQGLNRQWRAGWRIPALATAIMLALWLAGMAMGVWLLPAGVWYHGKTLAGHLLSWDGLWYLNVARNGYIWHPSYGELLGRYQNVDFYPLYPALEFVVMRIAHGHAPALILAPGILFGVASIFAFHRLARALLTPEAAGRATILYAVWPATVYFAMGYPTGLINLCAIAALGAYAEGRFWRAAFWAGLGTAAAPTMVFLAAGLCLDQGIGWLRRRAPAREVPRLIGFGLLSVFGLIGFILYQIAAFHDPFAFIKAQEAWGPSPPLQLRLARFFNPFWYIEPLRQAADELHRNFMLQRSGGNGLAWLRRHLNKNEQSVLNAISLLFGGIGIIAAFRFVKPRALPLASLVGLIGYCWFIATTDQNITAAPRLIFPALMLFAGLGGLAVRFRVTFFGLCFAFGILTILNAAFAAKGYFLI